MDPKEETGSEIAGILARIQEAYESAVLGFSGLASGTAKHEFIIARMEQMGELHEELCQRAGEEQATMLLAWALEHGSEASEHS